MRPLLKFALTAFLGISIFVAYRVYQKRKAKKIHGKKKGPVRKLRRTPTRKSPAKEEVKKGSDETVLRPTGSDVLHPLPFNNVTGTMSVEDKKEDARSTDDSGNMENQSTNKLVGSRTDSETLEIKKMPYSFENIAKFEPAKKSEEKIEEAPKEAVKEEKPVEKEPIKEEPKPVDPVKPESAPGPVVDIPKPAEPTPEDKKTSDAPTDPAPPAAPPTPEAAIVPPVDAAMKDDVKLVPVDFSKPPPPTNVQKLSYENTASPSSPGTSDPSSALADAAVRLSSESSMSNDMFQSLYKICRCRKKDRSGLLEDSAAPPYDRRVKAEFPTTKVIPVNFYTYNPPNLLETAPAAPEITELPEQYFADRENMVDNYLTGLYPMLGAMHAAHNHACLIHHLLENHLANEI